MEVAAAQVGRSRLLGALEDWLEWNELAGETGGVGARSCRM